jgi:hypothetical protein
MRKETRGEQCRERISEYFPQRREGAKLTADGRYDQGMRGYKKDFTLLLKCDSKLGVFAPWAYPNLQLLPTIGIKRGIILS